MILWGCVKLISDVGLKVNVYPSRARAVVLWLVSDLRESVLCLGPTCLRVTTQGTLAGPIPNMLLMGSSLCSAALAVAE